MQTADYPSAVENFDRVLPSAPTWFAAYIGLFRSFAAAEADAANPALIEDLLTRFRSEDSALLAPSLRFAFFGRALQTLGERHPETLNAERRTKLAQEAREVWNEAIANARTEADRFGLQVEAARTRAAFGDTTAAEEIAELSVEIERHEGQREWRLAFMAAASWKARQGDFASARAWIERSAAVAPLNLCAVENSPDFHSLQSEDPQEFAVWISTLKSKHKPDC